MKFNSTQLVTQTVEAVENTQALVLTQAIEAPQAVEVTQVITTQLVEATQITVPLVSKNGVDHRKTQNNFIICFNYMNCIMK